MSVSGDLWYVKLSDGDVHRVTLDQLDEAFQAGHIDADTMVLAAGETQWSKLGDLAGMGDDDEPMEADEADVADDAAWPHRAAQPFAAPPPQPLGSWSQAAAAPATVHAAAYAGAPAMASAPAGASASAFAPARIGQPAPPLGTAHSAFAGPASPFAAAASTLGPPGSPLGGALSSIPPRPYGAAPGNTSAAMPVRGTPVPSSLRPLSVDFGELDVDARKLRGGSGKKWFGVLVGLVAVGGIAAVAVQKPSWAQPVLTRIGLHHTEPVAAAAPAMPPPAPAPAPSPPSEPEPAPAPAATVTGAPVGDSPMNPRFTTRGNEPDPKTAHAAESKTTHGHKGAHGAAGHAPAPPKGKSSVFTTGGNKYDPLNSSI